MEQWEADGYHGGLMRAIPTILLGLALALAPGAQAERVRRVEVQTPPGQSVEWVLPQIRAAEGRPLDERLVDSHIHMLGLLGWVDAVDVDIRPAQADEFDLVYTLLPRNRVEEIRVEGSRLFAPDALENSLGSQEGETFDLRRALDDAHSINQMYQDAGYSFSGILDSENVEFADGVLTFKVRESQLSEGDRRRLEQALGRPFDGPVLRSNLAEALFDSGLDEELDLYVDRKSGMVWLQRAEATPAASLRSPDQGSGAE
jgi:hypothetical protein